MKYMHGTDERKHDWFWVLANRIGAGFLLIVFCTTIVFILFVVSSIIRRGDKFSGSMVVFTLCGVFIAVATAIGALQFLWANARYQLSATGIKVVYFFQTHDIEWQNVRNLSIRPVYILRNQPRDYIIVQVSNASPRTDYSSNFLDLSACWLRKKEFLAIRSTDSRIQEFRKYWNASDVGQGTVFHVQKG